MKDRAQTLTRRKQLKDDSLRPTTLASSVVVPFDGLRKQRQWACISEQLDEESSGRVYKGVFSAGRLWAAVAGVSGALAVVGLLSLALEASDGADGARSNVAATDADSKLDRRAAHVMADGSRAWLEPGAKLAVREDTQHRYAVSLGGAAEFDVTKEPSREFVVEAGPVMVRVIGTSFRVERSSKRVSVSVHEGLVEVVHAGQVDALHAGESWTARIESADALEEQPPIVEKETAQRDDAIAAQAPAEAAPPGASIGRVNKPEVPSVSAASGLWSRADQARRAKNYELAAELFSRFAKTYPRDSRADLAAFEAARLQQDALGNPEAALQALEGRDASSDDTLSEHALARRVEVLERLGQLKRCREARDEYLRTYPSGSHRGTVSHACGD